MTQLSEGTQNYFEKLANEELKTVLKPQNVDRLPRIVKGSTSSLIQKVDERGLKDEVKEIFSLDKVWERDISKLSGGELQRLAIAATIVRDADVFLFDEPTSYLDVQERVKISQYLNDMKSPDHTLVVVEHDLAMLDYLSDQIHIYYGEAGVYGIVLLALAIVIGTFVSMQFLLFVVGLIALLFFYSIILKYVLFADIILISINFVVRAVSGAFVIVKDGKPYVWVSP